MATLVYASFNTRELARAAADGLVRRDAPPGILDVVLHEDRLHLDEVSWSGTTARTSAALGAITVAAGATALGAFTSPGDVGGAQWLALIVFTSIYGGALGGLGGALVGSAIPKRVIEQLGLAVARGAHVVTVAVAGGTRSAALCRWLDDSGARYVSEA